MAWVLETPDLEHNVVSALMIEATGALEVIDQCPVLGLVGLGFLPSSNDVYIDT